MFFFEKKKKKSVVEILDVRIVDLQDCSPLHYVGLFVCMSDC